MHTVKINSTKEVHLYQASLNKWEKMEWIVQKAVEMDVSDITFFHAERSKRLKPTEQKLARIHKIAIEALEQCG